jgi:hypothetical protein
MTKGFKVNYLSELFSKSWEVMGVSKVLDAHGALRVGHPHSEKYIIFFV